MSYLVNISQRAKQDLRETYEYIAFELLSPEVAAGQLDRLEAAIISLADLPERHMLYKAEPWRSRGLRVMPVDNYCVFYIPDMVREEVTVLRVVYGKRDMRKIAFDETKQ